MGQILPKISELITNVTCRFSSRGSYKIIHTQEVEEVRERLLTTQDSHIITIPREDEDHDHDQLIVTNEIIDEQGLVIEIPDDDYHTVSTYPRENENGSRGTLEQNSHSSLVSTDAASKVVDNVAVQKEDVGGQPKQKKKRASKKKKDKWIKHYCSSHEILLVGEGDFSFSVCLSKAFGSARKMIATSLDSESRLKEYYEDAMSNINHLKNNGCTILHGVDATLMASHPVLSGLKFDRIIYNFPLVGFPKESKRTQLRRNRNLVLRFMKNAKELIKEDGEIHITHKSSTTYREWNLEKLAKQNRLQLIEEVEFKLWHYPGYNNKYGFGGNENFECYPSKTYKFGLKDVVVENVAPEANPENACRADQGLVIEIPDAYHTVSTNHKENDDGSRVSLEQNSQYSLVSTDAASKLVDNVAVQNKKRASRKKKDKWIKHYCSSHEILLVGEGDFSFSVCLSKAFGSASKMIATSLDSESKLKENYEDAMSNINHLKSNGCTILHEVDATVMASHPVLSGMKFDRIIYNFPLVGFSNESKRTQLKRNRNLVFKFMKNATELIKEDGEIHITHKSNTSYREWNLENLAKQNRLKLIEEVEFKLWHYPGYNNKYGFGGNKNFHCYPSKTYKFGLKDVVAGNVSCGADQENSLLETNALHLLAKEGAETSETSQTTISEDERSSKDVMVSPSHGIMEGRRLMEVNMQVVW